MYKSHFALFTVNREKTKGEILYYPVIAIPFSTYPYNEFHLHRTRCVQHVVLSVSGRPGLTTYFAATCKIATPRVRFCTDVKCPV